MCVRTRVMLEPHSVKAPTVQRDVGAAQSQRTLVVPDVEESEAVVPRQAHLLYRPELALKIFEI